MRVWLDDATNGGKKAHVSHLVGLVDDDGRDVAEVHRPHLEEILESSRAGHDELDTLVERTALRAVADAAVDRDRRVAFALGERRQLGHDLLGELTGRRQHERNGTLRAGIGQPGHERQAEAECLARTGRGAAGDVATSQRVGDHCSLDRERIAHPLALQTPDDPLGQPQVGEGHRALFGTRALVSGRGARGVIGHGHSRTPHSQLDSATTGAENSEMHSPVGGRPAR